MSWRAAVSGRERAGRESGSEEEFVGETRRARLPDAQAAWEAEAVRLQAALVAARSAWRSSPAALAWRAECAARGVALPAPSDAGVEAAEAALRAHGVRP